MRVLVFVSQMLDAEESVRIRDNAVDLASSKLVVDTMDEYGVEEALRLREAGTDCEIIAVAVGAEEIQEALRTVLAMGADRAIHVVSEEPLDPLVAGFLLAAVAKEEEADLLFAGGQHAGWDSQAVGAAAAEHLGWPQVTWTTELLLQERLLTGKHDTDAGSETFEAVLPAVITTQQGLNEPRYPTLPNIIKSRKKEVRREPAERFGAARRLRTVSECLQSKERLHKILDGKDASSAAAQLVDFLRNEAKVIA